MFAGLVLLQSFDQIQIAERSNIAVDVSLGVSGHHDTVDGIDSGGIRWIEFLPEFSLSCGDVDLDHLRWNLAVLKDKQRASIGRPAGGRFACVHAWNQTRLAPIDGIDVELAIRADGRDQFAVRSGNEG